MFDSFNQEATTAAIVENKSSCIIIHPSTLVLTNTDTFTLKLLFYSHDRLRTTCRFELCSPAELDSRSREGQRTDGPRSAFPTCEPEHLTCTKSRRRTVREFKEHRSETVLNPCWARWNASIRHRPQPVRNPQGSSCAIDTSDIEKRERISLGCCKDNVAEMIIRP